ncbi:efflux RND transporter permease subunit [Stutzerimonas tarimensis]|uniref:Efflux RND transporter permease subunit n=1 Tax=Stutzerimonas tarimensis TaxID=1507735 RepID=A0ABV7T5F0_9GAMM
MDFARYAIERSVNTWLLVLVCLAGGIVAFFNMGRLEDPEFTIKQAVVTVQYPGATALEVEQEVTEPLESAIQQMSQIKEIRSRSLDGMAELRIEIEDRYPSGQMPQIWDELRNKVRDAEHELAPDAQPPVVNDDFGDVYGIFYAMTGGGLTPKEMYEIAKDLRLDLLTAEGVGKVDIAGEQPERIVVIGDQARMAALNLSPQEITAALSDFNAVVDAGGVRAGTFYMHIRPTGVFDTLEALRALPIGQGPRSVRLGDVLEVRREYAERPRQIIRHNGQPAITLGVSGVSGANIVEVGENVEAVLAAIQPRLPYGVELHPLYQQHQIVNESVNDFALNVVMSIAIVVAVLCLSMGLRAGAIIGAVLALTVLGTLLIMWLSRIELERISLGAMIIAMGMLVDNAVVVCDGMLIQQQRGLKLMEAASRTLKQTQWPLLGATIIGILAFAGIGLSPDTTGEFLFSLFFVIGVSLLLSWVLALAAVPLFGHYLLRGQTGEEGGEAYHSPLYNRFRAVVDRVLRHAGLVVAVLAVLTILAGWGFGRLPQSFFPPSSTPIFAVTMFMPQGTHIQDTSRAAEDVEQYLLGHEGVTGVSTFVGSGAARFMLTYNPEQPNPALMHFLVHTENAEAIDGLVREINQTLPSRYPDTHGAAAQFLFGPNPEAKLEARISGPSLETLRELSAEGQRLLREQGEVLNVRDDWRPRAHVVRPLLDLDRMADAGLTRQMISLTMAASSDGAQVSVFRERDELIPILLRSSAADRVGPDDLLQRLIWSPVQQRYMPLAQVADGVTISAEDTLISRFDRVRTISVRAEPLDGENTNTAFERIRPIIESMELPYGYSLTWGGEYEQSSEAQGALIGTLAVPYLGMVLVTVLLFSRVRQPLVIWLVVPMSIIGVTLGLTLTGQSFGFMALLGLLSLTGMLIKNAVVLVDETDRQIADGVARRTAIIEASASRLRPVALAAGTTVLGMVPLLFDPFFAGMAVTIMAGLGFATLLTLLAVPCLYLLLMRVGKEER